MDNQNFQIVKYKKRNSFEYEVVPSSWVIGTKVYFPRKNMNTMIRDAFSKPDVDSWLSYQMARIKRTGYENYHNAVVELDKIIEEYTTDTEGQANDENYKKTRSKKHNVSNTTNRMIQLQLPPIFEKVGSKIPKNTNFTKMETEPSPTEMYNTEYLVDDEPAGVNSSLYQYPISQEGTQNVQYVVLQEPQTSRPETPLNHTNNLGTPLSVQPTYTAGETFIIGQLKELSAKMIDITNAVEMIMSTIKTPVNVLNNEPSCSKILNVEKLIKNEEGLQQFEDQSEDWKKQLRSELLVRIGKRQPSDVRSCCLELSDILICHKFWQFTSWAGGTKDENKPKFALQNYVVFLNFFKDIVRETTDASFSDKEFAAFFQGKMKNRNQLPTKLKRAASRIRNPKKRKLETSSNEIETNEYDQDLGNQTSLTS